MNNECPHEETTIIVLFAFDMVEVIGYKCIECKEIIKKETR